MHGRVGSAIEQIVLLGPGRDKVRALAVVLAATPVRRRESAQLRRTARPVPFAAPLRVRDHEQIVGTTPLPKGHSKWPFCTFKVQILTPFVRLTIEREEKGLANRHPTC